MTDCNTFDLKTHSDDFSLKTSRFECRPQVSAVMLPTPGSEGSPPPVRVYCKQPRAGPPTQRDVETESERTTGPQRDPRARRHPVSNIWESRDGSQPLDKRGDGSAGPGGEGEARRGCGDEGRGGRAAGGAPHIPPRGGGARGVRGRRACRGGQSRGRQVRERKRTGPGGRKPEQRRTIPGAAACGSATPRHRQRGQGGGREGGTGTPRDGSVGV